MRRLRNGKPLREAMRAAGLSIPRLSAETKRLDPEGGLSTSYIGFLATTGKSAREECSDHAAHLIARALDVPVHALFDTEPLPAAAASTSTRRREMNDDMRRTTLPVGLEPMVSVRELAQLIHKSTSWIYDQIKRAPETDFPVRYAGKSPRFIYGEVLDWMARPRTAARAAA